MTHAQKTTAMTIDDLRAWLARHDVDMDRVRSVEIVADYTPPDGTFGGNRGIYLRVEQYFTHPGRDAGVAVADEVLVDTVHRRLADLP